ncbi:MAG: sulfurtransferase [Burkholderiaceae bacterium]
MFTQPLISAERVLSQQRTQEPLTLIDVRFDLADVEAGRNAWRAGHVPGSLYWHLDTDLSRAKNGHNGRHPLPERADFARTLGRAGIAPHSRVVTLDAQGGVYAARAWWMLRWMGHDAVAVLDGGIAAWLAAGGALSTDPVAPGSAPPYPDRPALVQSRDAAALAATLGNVRLIDARAPERFRGEVEPLDKQAGHIPGALNRFFKDNLDTGGRFKPADRLREEFAALMGGPGPQGVVHSCGSGVTACHNLLAMEVAGLTGSALYPGSWSEWSSDPARPIARG